MNEAICDICKKDFSLDEHGMGLVIRDKYYACQDCCSALSKESLFIWTTSRMGTTRNFKQIFQWVWEKEKQEW
ncbi:hypothetical protein JXC34_03250 [Candidatus Woesearchaeota archaeon]|nr:hypothetical protein [Candidatus Woesearchaeota archaeon]